MRKDLLSSNHDRAGLWSYSIYILKDDNVLLRISVQTSPEETPEAILHMPGQ